LRVDFEADSHLRDIQSQAFQNCVKLASIEIPKSVESLSPQCFDSCTGLGLIRVESGSRLRTVSNSITQLNHLNVIYVPSSVAHVFLRGFEADVPVAAGWSESALKLAAPGQRIFRSSIWSEHRSGGVFFSLIVFEDYESGVLPGWIGPDEFGWTDEFGMGYLQALDDMLMNCVQVYSVVGNPRAHGSNHVRSG
jgi:hypothetical protein